MRIFQYLHSHLIHVMDGDQSIPVNQGDEVVAGPQLAAGLEHRTDFVEVTPRESKPEPQPAPEPAKPEVQSTPTE